MTASSKHIMQVCFRSVKSCIDCVGEFMQLGSKEEETERFNHYMKKTYKKTASLIANSCKAVSASYELYSLFAAHDVPLSTSWHCLGLFTCRFRVPFAFLLYTSSTDIFAIETDVEYVQSVSWPGGMV